MATRDAPGGGTGGTGFLFGNIDRHGRLDEEYLSDEAKDTIENVGAKVVGDGDHQLREIEALPLKSAVPAEDDDDYDDDDDEKAPGHPAAAGVDYYDEDDELDDADRPDMAEIALRKFDGKGKPAEEDDDDYDDDDDDADADAAPAPAAPEKSAEKPAENSALAAQQRLMADARRLADARLKEDARLEEDARSAPPAAPAAAPPDSEDDPLLFSRFFTRPAPTLRFAPRQRRFGFVAPSEPAHDVRADDAERLERKPVLPAVDPSEVVVALDARHAALRKPRAERRRPPPTAPDREEYLAAAQPLEDHRAAEGVDDRDYALVQQASWEDDIAWGGEAEPEDEWWGAELESGKGGAEEDEDDEFEFEDAMIMNVDDPGGGDAAKKPAKDGMDDDDDEDMGWEDADTGDVAQLPGNGKDSRPEVKTEPGMDDDDDMDWEDAGPTADEGAQKQDATQKPVGSQTGVKKEPGADRPTSSDPSLKEKRKDDAVAPVDKAASNAGKKADSATAAGKKLVPTGEITETIIAPNRDLAEGTWVHAIAWDSNSESESDEKREDPKLTQARFLKEKFARLILDMNDSNMVLEHLSDESKENGTEVRVGHVEDQNTLKLRMKDLIFATGTQVQQLLEADMFNVSNDLYYARGATNHLKIDRRHALRGLQNAPPVEKCQTTKTCIPEAELLYFRRPKLSKKNIPEPMILQTLRRKRPKGGRAQIAGQIPKRKAELQCSEKDAYRVALYEYPLERQPPIMLVPGMASRVVTYQRKQSAAEAQKASKDAAGTAEADTVFMAPDEIPPVAAGDIQADEKPLSVVESHVFSAPCVKTAPHATDFLLTQTADGMIVREIDSVISVGVTEPKVEVMAPNTDRYKKYSKDRAYLWIVREFSRQQRELMKAHKKKKDSDGALRHPPYITKEEIWREFFRRRTYPQGSLSKLLKDTALYQNGKYTMPSEPKPGTPRENELLRVLNPNETAAFEAMEAGWEQILNRGIRTYTHPSAQGNLLSATDPGKSGLEYGTAVGTYFKCHLLRTPWYVSANKIVVHRAQRKELLQVLSLARIVNDLREGGNVMESRLMSLSPAEMNNVLSNHYKLNAKKIPGNIDDRRELVREMSQRKTKSTANDVSNYSQVIANVLKKHRDAGLGKGAAIAALGTAMVGGTHLGPPLDVQRRALEDGEVEDLPIEEEDFYPEKEGEAVYAAAKRLLGRRKENRTDKTKTGSKADGSAKKSRPSEHHGPRISAAKPPLPQGLRSPKKSGASSSKNRNSSASTDDPKKPKKKVTVLRVTKSVTDEDGKQKTVIERVTDPNKIAFYLQKTQKKKQKKDASAKDPNTSGVKINIALNRLSQGGKAANKDKDGTSEKKKLSKKGGKKGDGSSNPTVRKIAGERGQIGKIKINTKQLHSNKEQAALKRKRSQYGEDIDYRAKKTAKTSRRKRNGKVQLNGILERIEKYVRETEGYIVPRSNPIRIARLKHGESPPPNIVPSNLAIPKGTGLDFTAAVDTKVVPTYMQIIKEPMYLNLVRQRCRGQKYNTGAEFVHDMQLMASNARLFNSSPDVQWVVQHAQLLLDVAVEQVSRRADEIQAAEEMVKLEMAEQARAGDAYAKSKKSKSKAKGKKSSSKKNNNPKDVVIIDEAEKPSQSQPGSSMSADIVDLIDDPPLGDQTRDPAASPAASPEPGASMLDAGITADDIYAIDKPDTLTDGMQESADNLVLDLDDVGGVDGL